MQFGVHIVPEQFHDASGRLVPATSLLDNISGIRLN
jgi:hypothetical protein